MANDCGGWLASSPTPRRSGRPPRAIAVAVREEVVGVALCVTASGVAQPDEARMGNAAASGRHDCPTGESRQRRAFGILRRYRWQPHRLFASRGVRAEPCRPALGSRQDLLVGCQDAVKIAVFLSVPGESPRVGGFLAAPKRLLV